MSLEWLRPYDFLHSSGVTGQKGIIILGTGWQGYNTAAKAQNSFAYTALPFGYVYVYYFYEPTFNMVDLSMSCSAETLLMKITNF